MPPGVLEVTGRRHQTEKVKVKVIVDFPRDLIVRVDDDANDEGIDRSKLIRKAVETYLNAKDRHRRELGLAKAYSANAELAVEVVEECSALESHNL